MKEIEMFVHRLFKKQKYTIKDPIAMQKLIEMLTEKVEDLIEEGMVREDAVHKTLVEFGELDDFYLPLVKREKRRYQRVKTLRHYRNDLLFSCLASLLIIAIMIYLYYAFFEYRYWFIVPSLGILFWPLSLLYKLLNKRGE